MNLIPSFNVDGVYLASHSVGAHEPFVGIESTYQLTISRLPLPLPIEWRFVLILLVRKHYKLIHLQFYIPPQ